MFLVIKYSLLHYWKYQNVIKAKFYIICIMYADGHRAWAGSTIMRFLAGNSAKNPISISLPPGDGRKLTFLSFWLLDWRLPVTQKLEKLYIRDKEVSRKILISINVTQWGLFLFVIGEKTNCNWYLAHHESLILESAKPTAMKYQNSLRNEFAKIRVRGGGGRGRVNNIIS